ncbi:unnamed protein product [Gemmata massiliana]|uniref:Uncharacterized protein n=1 Tax=Gemmata massiliana TaxID=1210884 RepID=A0A6P2CYT8_9BACT|nr:unnamed protein product [Gemmata massiliana]
MRVSKSPEYPKKGPREFACEFMPDTPRYGSEPGAVW